MTAHRFKMPAAWSNGRALKIVVVGCGGTGSEVVDALCRLHYTLVETGHPQGLAITLIDGDVVSPSNVGRQRFLHCDVGEKKTDVLAERYGMLFGLPITGVTEHLAPAQFGTLNRFDLVITCVDRAAIRLALGRHWADRRCETLWLDCGNGDATAQVILGHLGQPALAGRGMRLPNVVDLYPNLSTVNDDDAPSCGLAQALKSQMLGINRFVADAAIFAVLAPMLMAGETGVHGAFLDLPNATMRPLRIDHDAWSFINPDLGVESPIAKAS